jgi:uncharacterized protein (DUF927 family)
MGNIIMDLEMDNYPMVNSPVIIGENQYTRGKSLDGEESYPLREENKQAEEQPIGETEDEHAQIDRVGRKMYFGCYIPEGYNLNMFTGTWVDDDEEPDKNEQICSIRIMVTGRFRSVDDDGEDIVRIKIIDKSIDKTILVPISAITDTNGFRTHLIPKSVRVIESKRKLLFQYLNACIDANENEAGSAFVTGLVYHTHGWKDDNCTTFVAGNRLFRDNYGKLKEEVCNFGDEGTADIFNRKGSLTAWVAGVKHILKYTNPRFVMYAAFTAPLLKWLGVSPFAVDLYGGISGSENSESSSGKTTTCIIAMSGFGNVKQDPRTTCLFNTCDNTTKFVTNILARYPDLPCLFDEATNLPKKERDELAYSISNPVGRGRATTNGGTQKQQQKRNVALVTGEHSFIPESGNTGAKVRVQSIKGGIGVPNLSDEVISATNACMNNSGYILELFLDEFFKNRASVSKWHEEAWKRLAKTTDNDLTKRKASYFAATETAGMLLEKVFGIIGIEPKDPRGIIYKVWKDNILNSEIKPRWLVALSEVWDWYNLHKDTNFDIGKTARDTFGWSAFEKETKRPLLNINKQPLTEFLQDERKGRSYDPKSTFESWRVAGITNVNDPALKKDGTRGAIPVVKE